MTVEDGTGLAAADSYVSLTDATTYFTNHGSPAAWTAATDATKESALRYAARWLDARYPWLSSTYNVTTPQALAWPRWSFVDMKGRTIATGVPQVVKDAQCEAALAHLSTSLASPLDRGGSISEVQVGPIDVKYSPGAASSRTFAYIDALVSDVALSSTAAQVSLIRG